MRSPTSERGRAFLAEHARRNHNADTEQLLAAIEQLQSVVVAQSAPQATDRSSGDCVTLLDDIVTAQCDLDAHSFCKRRRACRTRSHWSNAESQDMLEVASRREVPRRSRRHHPHPKCAPNRPKIPSERISQLCRCPSSRNCQSHRRLLEPTVHSLVHSEASWQRSHSWSHRPRLVLTPVGGDPACE